MCVKALEDGGLMPAEDFLVRFPHRAFRRTAAAYFYSALHAAGAAVSGGG